jgi:riboflavin transporter FmnP
MLVVVAVVVGAGACSSLLLNVVFMLPSFLAFTSESMNQSSSIFLE